MKKAIVFLGSAVIVMLFVSRSRVHHEELSDAAQVQITNKQPESEVKQLAEVVVPTSVETNTPAVTNVVKPRKVTIVIDPKLAAGPQK